MVLGYQGTLIPDSAHSATATAGINEADCIPEFSLAPWLESASRKLGLRLSAERLDGRGERIDIGAWIDALRERLTGTLTQVLAVCPDLTEQQVAHQFPLLSTLLKCVISEWVDAIAVFHRRLHSDAARLAEWLGYTRLPGLASLTPASSDQHDGAHTVMRLVFRDGRCVYYKPRPVTGEWLWDRLVHAVNVHSSLQLASAPALAGPGGQYGWIASLRPHGQLQHWDKGSAEASEYWRAAGAMLCLAEHVRMTDLHMGNVMATGCGPALFDAESLGTPRTDSETPVRRESELPFTTTIHDLLDTGLLPSETSAGLPDTSGLFGKAAAVPKIKIPRWSACAGGGRRVEMVPAALVDHGNAPPHTSPLEVLPLLVSGYREAAHALLRCRESLVAPGSAWRWTLEHQHAPRIILRDTLSYNILLSRSLQPNQLECAQRRRTELRSALRGHGHRALPLAVLRMEARVLLGLHIPRFTALPGSRTLASNSGRALAFRFLSCSPAEAVLRKVGGLTPDLLTEVQIPSLLQVVFAQSG
ncbi:MAG: DUF4135 domain-containing protein [Terracidiphilus sp.]